jgi:hypothetical protein
MPCRALSPSGFSGTVFIGITGDRVDLGEFGLLTGRTRDRSRSALTGGMKCQPGTLLPACQVVICAEITGQSPGPLVPGDSDDPGGPKARWGHARWLPQHLPTRERKRSLRW